MSIVCVQYGQCGNQVGNSLYNTINEDIKNKDQNSVYCKKIVNKWFNVTKQGKWEPRSVLVDTELKAVESQYKLPFKFKNVASKALGGSANNWAFGYVNNSRILKNEILDTIRSEIEKCDYMTSIVNILSSSGGTGSGLGTRIIESLRDEYSTKNFTNVIVLPYLKGEIVTQSYNCILALSHLYSLADNTILFQNEKLHHVCNFNLDIKDITMKNINTVIAQQLVSIFQPIKNVNTCDMLSELCCHRDYKYLQVKNEPIFYENMHKYESDSKWKVLVNSLTKQSRFEYNQQVQLKQPLKTKNICSLLVSRGIDQCPESDTNILRDKKLYVPWITPTETFKHHHEPNKFLSLNRSLTQITNSNQVYFPLNSIVEDAWNLFTHQAYLHHYKKFGIDEDFFLNSFQTMENIILNEYWTLEDKTRLLGVLRTHGASNLEVICQQMPDKSLAEIQFIVDKFSKAAQTKYIATEWDDSEEPIVDKWAKILKKLNFKHNASVHDVLPRVLKYIALFEDREIDESAFNIRECYKLLSDIAYGLPSKDLDQTENYFLYDCLTKLSLALKKQDLGAYKDYLKTLEDFEELAKEKPGGLPGNPKKTTTMNPLKIPEDCLVFNEEDRQLSEYVNYDNNTQQ